VETILPRHRFVLMSPDDHARQMLEQRLAQARRLAREPVDELTKERLESLIRELEVQLNDHPLQPRDPHD
jgi:hypothetical protein